MRTFHQSRIDEIMNRYNPDYDLPQDGQPQVTWVEAYLVDIIVDLDKRIEKLEKTIENQKTELRRAATLAAGESLI